VVDSAAAAEAVALDVLQTFFEVFGYRGQWRLEIRRHRGERAESKAVYSSLTPQDFATAASHAGFEATVKETDSPPFVALTHGRRRFVAFMESRVSGQNLYSLIALQAQLTLNRPVTDEAIARANMAQQFVKVWRTDKHSVRLHMPLALDGGVTTAWLTQSLRHWIGSWRVCERQLRRGDTEATGLILQGTELVQ
jgi:hypothetical protein